MKKAYIFLFILMSGYIKSDGIYLWQYFDNGSASCCLHIKDQDICNPNVACTRNQTADLLGIYDYIGRVLHMENIGNFPYAKLLNDAQAYIRKIAAMPNKIFYHSFENRFNVKFFHTMVLEHAASKNDKNKTTAKPMTEAEKQKASQKEVWDYLVKIGLASRTKKS